METMKMIRITLCPASTKPIARLFLALFIGTLPGVVLAAPKGVSYSNAPSQIDAYDYAEITAIVDYPDARDPFVDATLTGSFETEDGSQRWNVEGFCDSTDGSIFRIRFMPPHAGHYQYSVRFA